MKINSTISNFNQLAAFLNLDFTEINHIMNAVQDGSVFITCKERKIADRLLRVPSRSYMGGTIKC